MHQAWLLPFTGNRIPKASYICLGNGKPGNGREITSPLMGSSEHCLQAEGFGSPRINCGALGQTHYFLDQVSLIHKMGTVAASQVYCEVKLDCRAESPLPDAMEVSQQWYFSPGPQGFLLWEGWKSRCSCGGTRLRAGGQVFRQNHTAMY